MAIEAEELKALVTERIYALGMQIDSTGGLILPDDSKAFVRALHRPATETQLRKDHKWIKTHFPRYGSFFASGRDINVDQIQPRLIQVTKKWENDLWRLARYTWLLPYSQGYGRRMRYLLIDEHNQKLIGIFALQSPPISFPARDRRFKYHFGDDKAEVVNQTADVHTLGAIMPYSRLLGGKLVAFAVASDEVRKDYRRKYLARVTLMEKRELSSELVAMTTTSAFGRSSIYNRLEYCGDPIAISLGFTEGYGHFHLDELYPTFKEFLEQENVPTHGGYGTGPRPKWQLMRTALKRLGFQKNLLKHGIRREAFLFPLIENLEEFMNGETEVTKPRHLPFTDLVSYWRTRWLMPRAARVEDWRDWDSKEYAKAILLESVRDSYES